MLRRYRRCAISARLETSRDDHPSKTLFANVNLVPELTTPAILLLSFAGGWLLMSLLSLLTSDGFQSWPLIPAVIMSLIGAAFLMGEKALKALSYVGQAWPLVLIVIGLYIILVRKGVHSA